MSDLERLDWIEKNVMAWIDNHEYVAAYPNLSTCLEDQVRGGRVKLVEALREIQSLASISSHPRCRDIAEMADKALLAQEGS